MPEFSFPANPTLGDTYTSGNRTWRWEGNAWLIVTDLSTHEALTTTAHGGIVPDSRTVSVSGTGLSGGGDLSADRTITIDPSALAGDAAFTGAYVSTSGLNVRAMSTIYAANTFV
jgi:hypothetical protein